MKSSVCILSFLCISISFYALFPGFLRIGFNTKRLKVGEY